METQKNQISDSVSLMKKCVDIDNRREYSEEYVELLVSCNRWQDAWDFYESLPQSIKNDEALIMSLLPAACRLRKREFLEQCFKRVFVLIREGGRVYTESWFWLQAMRLADERGVPFSEELVKECEKRNEIPLKYDFRMG